MTVANPDQAGTASITPEIRGAYEAVCAELRGQLAHVFVRKHSRRPCVVGAQLIEDATRAAAVILAFRKVVHLGAEIIPEQLEGYNDAREILNSSLSSLRIPAYLLPRVLW